MFKYELVFVRIRAKAIKKLEVLLDSNLHWNTQIQRVKERAIETLMACGVVVGQRWSLNLAIMQWIYTVDVIPMVT
jgi:hypothetical protein